jgi:hypothetical protein
MYVQHRGELVTVVVALVVIAPMVGGGTLILLQ